MIEINQKKLCENCFKEITEESCPHCGYPDAQATADLTVLPVGTKLGNKILIGKVMGKGGFGVTYLGYDLRMDKTIAVKEYYPNGISYRSANGTEVSLADPKSEETFQRGAEKFYSEAEMVAQFNGNPNIVGVYDYFRENNTVYLVMEYINGVTLKQYIHNHGSITDAQALFMMDKIAAALSITHSASVLHRDISPDNIMICTDGKIKLIDFGAARQIMAESSSNLTVVLKPGYTPIEQYTKKGRQGAWTDIYALGVSMYYALTGTTLDDPYERMDGDDEWEKNRHGIHNGLWKILKKCTMIQAADRYESAIELRKALSAISGNLKPQPITLDEKETANTVDSAETAKEPEMSIPATSPGKQPQDETAEAPAKEDSASETTHTQEDLDAITQDLPIDESGYDPSVNIYKKKRGKSKGKSLLMAGALAAALIICIVGIIFVNRGNPHTPVNTESEVLEVRLGNSYLGAWSRSDAIPKEVLESFGSDVSVTLNVTLVSIDKEEDNSCLFAFMPVTGEEGRRVHVSASTEPRGTSGDDESVYDIARGSDSFTFVISADEIAALNNEGLAFQAWNVILRSATLSQARP